jgi:hypothetical protein
MTPTQRILMTDNVFAMFKKANECDQFENNSFSGLQTFFRITFKNGLMTNASKDALEKHYGSKEVVAEKTLSVYRLLSAYENEVVAYQLMDKTKSNNFMRKFEEEMSIFGLSSSDLRDVYLISKIKEGIYHNAFEF